MSLGKRLKQARKAKGLTLRELSRLSGVASFTRISEIENDLADNSTIKTISAIANTLEVSIDWLVYGEHQHGIYWRPIDEFKIVDSSSTYMLWHRKEGKSFSFGNYANITKNGVTEDAIQVGVFFFNLDELKEVFTHFIELIPPKS